MGCFAVLNETSFFNPSVKNWFLEMEWGVKSIFVLRMSVLNTNCFVACMLNSVEWNGKAIFDTDRKGVHGE